MNAGHEHLADVEQRLERALQAEAGRCSRREPPLLAAACRAPRRASVQPRSHAWRWAAAATVTMLLALPIRQCLHTASQRALCERPATVLPVIDRETLYAALPKIPAPTRPPPPGRLRAELVITAPAPFP